MYGFKNRTFAAFGLFLLLIEEEKRFSFLRKVMWMRGKEERERKHPHFYNWWSLAALP